MNFELLNFSKNEHHNFIDVVFQFDSTHFCLMINKEKKSVIISLDCVVYYPIKNRQLEEALLNTEIEDEIETILKNNLDFFPLLFNKIDESNKKISTILSNPLIKQFHNNFLKLKDDTFLCKQLITISDDFITEYQKYNFYPATTEWNYLYSLDDQFSLYVLSYFSKDIKNCNFFIDISIFDKLNIKFLNDPLICPLLHKFSSEFFHDSIKKYHSLVHFSKVKKDLFSIFDYIDYFLKKSPFDFFCFFLDSIEEYNIDVRTYFLNQFTYIYDDHFSHYNMELLKYCRIINIDSKFDFIEKIIYSELNKAELNTSFLNIIFDLIANSFYKKQYIGAYRIFYILNNQQQLNMLEEFKKNGYNTSNDIFLAMFDYCKQRELIENF